MKTFLTIFRKEWIDTFRDRRTIVTMILIPLLVFPLIMMIVTKVSATQRKKAQEKTLTVAVIADGNAAGFLDAVHQRSDVRLVENVLPDSIEPLIQRDSLDGAFVFADDFDRRLLANESGSVRFFYKSTDEDDNITKRRLQEMLQTFERKLLAQRLQRLRLSESVVNVVEVQEQNVASMKERIGRFIGGFLPYIFVIFCFMGSMYPAIDLGAGEKERGTLETLLTTPVSRFQILLGKYVVVVLAGMVSALVSILGLYFSVRQAVDIPPELVDVVLGILEMKTILLVLSLLLPLTIFFASVLLSLSIYAKSFKEAQSIISPMSFIVIVPVAIGLMPGIKLTETTALIPVLNVSLATKEIMAGTVPFGLLLEVYAILLVLAVIGLYGTSKWFGREETIFRGV
jgi:sodium transport system permease protein